MARLNITIEDWTRLDEVYDIVEDSPIGYADIDETADFHIHINCDDLTEDECCKFMQALEDKEIIFHMHADDSTLNRLMAEKYVLFMMDDSSEDFEEFVRSSDNPYCPSKAEINEYFEKQYPLMKKKGA